MASRPPDAIGTRNGDTLLKFCQCSF
ncbi:hypothetical protein FAGKG844_350016 [Frankia sp. AgKG'84/4]